MADRLKYARARQIIIDALKKDLMGPESEEEILFEDPLRHRQNCPFRQSATE